MLKVHHTVALAGGMLTVRLATPSVRLLELCGFASRHNPKRGFLFVSRVLGKHLPVRPSSMAQTHKVLAAYLRSFVTAKTLFLGFAETATGLGAGVFEASVRLQPDQGLTFVQTTRYQFDAPLALHFQEEHSHSTGHLLYVPKFGAQALQAQRVVLLDDELSTGKTSLNFIKELQTVNPNLQAVALVSLVNWMGEARKQAMRDALPGLHLEFHSLLQGEFEFIPRAGYVCPEMPSVDSNGTLKDLVVPKSYGRFGEAGLHQTNFPAVVARLGLDPARPVHVLGDGEFMHPPYLFASFLERQGFDTWFQSTTRSPILPGEAIETKASFSDHYGEGIPNFAYNLPNPDGPAQVVLCHESTAPLTLAEQRPLKTVFYKELLCA